MGYGDLSKLRIVYYPDPVLRAQSKPVGEFSSDLAALASRMLELMKAAPGVGLAAPQVGIPIRLFVYNPTGETGGDRVCVNPVLSDLVDPVEGEEGCLSLPDVKVPIRRARSARLSAFDAEGRAFELWGTDLEARIWQHESDHLDGKLIIDSMPASAELANRRLLKQLKADYGRKPARRP
jgi:peptide deformylase